MSKSILYIITGLSTGGAEMMLYKLLSRINREQFSPVVVSLMDRGTLGDRIEALGIPIHTIGMKSGKLTPASVWRLIRIVRQLQPDLIQGWMTHGNLAAQLASLFVPKKVPILWNIRDSALSTIDTKTETLLIIKLLSYLSPLPIKIIYNSKAGAYGYEKMGYSSEKTEIIPNGFDTSLFTNSLEIRRRFRVEELGISEETLLIGLIGRFHPMKDHPNFFKAAKILSEKKTNVQFVLAGKSVDWDNQLLRRIIQELELTKHVYLLGERHDIPYLTAALDIATTSSYSEGFPNVIGEAMSCGVPCVVTDIGDCAWIVGDTGQVVPPRNPEALCAGWLKLIDMEVEARRDLSARARQRIEELFSIETIVQKYEQLYQEIVYGEQYRPGSC
jgi:glycosyltransferase involved in cell wall biosynthesis